MRQVADTLIEEFIEVELVFGEEPERVDGHHEVFVEPGEVFKWVWHHVEIEGVALQSLIRLKILKPAYSHLCGQEPHYVLSVLPVSKRHSIGLMVRQVLMKLQATEFKIEGNKITLL